MITVEEAKMDLLQAICSGLSDDMSDLEPWLGDRAEEFDDDTVWKYQQAKALLLREFTQRIRRYNKGKCP